MPNDNLIEHVKRYLQLKRQESIRNRQFLRFGFALDDLNIEAIREFLNDGIDIREYEKEDSTMRKVIMGYDHKLYAITDNYRRKNTKMKDIEFFKSLIKMGNDEMPQELKDEIEPLAKEVFELLKALYARGANINHNFWMGKEINLFSEKPVKYEAGSILKYALVAHSTDKQLDIFNWLLSLDELELDPSIVEMVVEMANPESVEILDKLTKRGFRGVKTSYYGLFEISPLIQCVIHPEIPFHQEKFNILWKVATEEEKKDLVESWKLDNIQIPEENIGEPDTNTGLKM